MKSIIINSSEIAISPQKLNLIASIIRKKSLDYSIEKLEFLNKKGARIFLKFLKGTAKNIEKDNGETKEYYLDKVLVNKGKIRKKAIYRAKGRTDRLRKRYSKISLCVEKFKNN